jgi:hypothetical protein
LDLRDKSAQGRRDPGGGDRSYQLHDAYLQLGPRFRQTIFNRKKANSSVNTESDPRGKADSILRTFDQGSCDPKFSGVRERGVVSFQL